MYAVSSGRQGRQQVEYTDTVRFHLHPTPGGLTPEPEIVAPRLETKPPPPPNRHVIVEGHVVVGEHRYPARGT